MRVSSSWLMELSGLVLVGSMRRRLRIGWLDRVHGPDYWDSSEEIRGMVWLFEVESK